MKSSSNQQNQMTSVSTRESSTSDGRKGQAKERKPSSDKTDPNDFGVCLLRDSPYRILRVSQFQFVRFLI